MFFNNHLQQRRRLKRIPIHRCLFYNYIPHAYLKLLLLDYSSL